MPHTRTHTGASGAVRLRHPLPQRQPRPPEAAHRAPVRTKAHAGLLPLIHDMGVGVGPYNGMAWHYPQPSNRTPNPIRTYITQRPPPRGLPRRAGQVRLRHLHGAYLLRGSLRPLISSMNVRSITIV